jgi:hypothetical protein
MTRVGLFTFIVLSAGLPAVAFLQGGFPILAIAALLLNVLWILGIVREWKWVNMLGILGNFTLAAAGLLLGLSKVLDSAGSLAALIAWDLADFSFRLRMAAQDDDTSRLQRIHMIRILLVAFAGAVVLITVQTVHLDFTFEWMALLLLFAVWGVGRIFNGLLKKEK